MGNDVSIFNNSALPAHVLKARQQGVGNIKEKEKDRSTVPTLSYTGKVWSVALNGDIKKLEGKNADGDLVPLSVMRVVILDYNERRGRRYYAGDYNPDKKAAPACWSDDGLTPHESVKEPPCGVGGSCKTCPMSAKNSKVNAFGKGVAACAEHRVIVVVPANDLDFPPLRMQLAVTSDWDTQSPDLVDQGWRAFKNYVTYLKQQDTPSTTMLVTKMRFDPNVAYPKVLFSYDRWLDEAEWRKAEAVAQSDAVKSLLKGVWTPNGVDGAKIAEKTAEVVEFKKPAPKPALDDDDVVMEKPVRRAPVDDDEVIEEKPKRTRRTKAQIEAEEAAAKPKAAKRPLDDEDDVDEDGVITPRAKAAPVADDEDDDDGLADLRNRWKGR